MKRFVVLLSLPAVLLFAQGPWGMGMPERGTMMQPGMVHPMMLEEGRIFMGPGFENILDELGLEADAVKKAEDLWYAHQKEMLDLKYRIEKARLELEEYVAGGKFSVDRIMEKWTNIQKLKDNMERKRMEFRIAIFKLLPKEKQKEMGWWLIGSRRGMMKRHLMKVKVGRHLRKTRQQNK